MTTWRILRAQFWVWLQSAVLAFVLSALGDAQDASALYFPLVAIMLLAAAAWVTALGMGLSILSTRVIPPRWMQQWIPVAIALASVAFLVGQQALMGRFSIWAEAMVFLTGALLDMRQLTTVATSLMALAAVTVLAVGWLFERAFYGGWNSFQEVPVRRATTPMAARRRRRLDWLTRFLPIPQRFLIVKEWRTLAREPLRLVSLFLIPLMTGVLLFPCLGTGNPYHALVFWILLFYGGLFATLSVQALVLVAVGLAGACAMAMAFGTLGADFAATDPRHSVTGPLAFLGTALAGLFHFLALLSAAWLVIHLYPENDLIAQARQAVGGYAAIGWLFQNGIWVPLALAGSQAVCWLGTRALWGTATHRLERVEAI